MSSEMATTKPHVVLTAFPAQGHLKPLLNLAKLLHFHNFHISFVLTEFTYRRLFLSRGPDSVKGQQDFKFYTIPDGLPPSDADSTQDIVSLCASTRESCPVPFKELIQRLNGSGDSPAVDCIVSDGGMSFTVNVASELKIPVVVFITHSGCGFLSYLSFADLVKRGYTPLRDDSCLTNGYLDTPIDHIPGLKNMRLRDFPSFIRTTNLYDPMLNIMMQRKHEILQAKGLILNTFQDLEFDVLSSLNSKFLNLYTIGPLSPLSLQTLTNTPASSIIGSNLWKEDSHCITWLNNQSKGSVIYVNFGSITVVTKEQLDEFAWGLAHSMHPFLWVIRPDLVKGGGVQLSNKYVREIQERGVLVPWCNQEEVLAHESIGGFLTHCGWNSTLESIYEGVPMICWPFFAEQPTNCRYACCEWGIGMEIGENVRREEIGALIRELMEGKKGRELRKRALEWKAKARRVIGPGGSSWANMKRLVEDLAHIKMNC